MEGNMKNIEIKTGLLLMAKGLIQLLKIIISFALPLLIAVYFYALFTAICDGLLTPDLSLSLESISGLIMLLVTPVFPIVFGIIVIVFGVVYKIVKSISSILQAGLSNLLLCVESSLDDKCVFDTILDSKKLKYAITLGAEILAAFLLYIFFAKYDFNMNAFCYAIGGSSTFGDLIDINEQFKMLSFYATMLVMIGASLYYVTKNYVDVESPFK